MVKKIEQELHASVAVDKVRLTLFPAFLILDDFELEESKDAPRVLKSKQIILSFSPWSLLTEFLLINKIHFQDPEIHLIWNHEGKTNFDFLKTAFVRSRAPNQKSPVIIQKITLINGSLDIDQDLKNNHVSMKHIEFKTDTDPTMTFFQISGSAKKISYQSGRKDVETFASADWRLSITPQHLEIKRFAVSAKETAVTLKGIVSFPPNQKTYPFKVDSDFHFGTRALLAGFDTLTGHGLIEGNYDGEKQIKGSLILSHLAFEKDKGVHKFGELKSRFSFEPGLIFFDDFNSKFFGGKIDGKIKFRFNDSSSLLETDYRLHNVSLSQPVLLFFPRYKIYSDGKTLDASGTLKLINMDMHQLSGSGHFRLTGTPQRVLNSKTPLWESAMNALVLAETDYELRSSAFFFSHSSLQIGSSLINGNGAVQQGGTFSTFLNLRSENGGEVISWLGYPQWSGAVDFTGEARGTFTSPVFEGKGTASNVFFDNHSLGTGSAHLKYSDHRLEFTQVKINKGKGEYSGEGNIHWKSLDEFNYQINAFASPGIPDDIIRIFIDNIPLYTQATGPVVISGDHQTFSVKGNLDVANGFIYDQGFDQGHVEIEITGSGVSFNKTSLVHGNSSVTGKGKIFFNGEYEGELKSENFRFTDLTVLNQTLPEVQGSFNGNIHGSGTFEHPDLILAGALADLSYKNQKIKPGLIALTLADKELKTHLTFNEYPMIVDGSIGITTPFVSKLEIQGEKIPLGSWFNAFNAESNFQAQSFTGSVSGKIGIEGPLNDPKSLNLSAHLTQLKADLSGYEIINQEEIVFTLSDGKLNIDSCRLKGEGTTLSIAGGLDLFRQYRLFITGEADLSLLKALRKEITYGKGKAYLALNIYDRWNDPKLQGGLTIQDGQIRTTAVSQAIRISSMALFFNERQVFLESLDAGFGEGALHGTGKIDLDRFKVAHFGLILEAKESRFSLFPGWTSTVSGSLFYQGDLSTQALQGELTLNHGVYNKKIDVRSLLTKLSELEEKTEPTPLIGKTRLNVRLTGDDDLRINNNLARLPFTVDLTVKGTVDHPVLIGRMEADSGSILFYNRTFSVNSIAVDFIDPEAIKPLIDLKARTQVTGKDNKSYQIDLSFAGGLDKIKPTLTADDPGLTETDILSLILAGRTATEVATDPFSQQQIGGQFVPLVIESPLEGLLEDLTGVNRLFIEPLPSGIRSTGGPRVTVEQRLLGEKLLLTYSYTINPSQDQIIKMEYLINRHIFLQGIRNEEGNAGGNLKFRFEFK